ncbi:MAG: 50S ribosomal protein L11 methyltransferase, partial [Actinobacteria bacterium]|nr:50S ribosomal protein L11 methyltransferase [Actinomycetota bacterium]
YAEEPPLGFDVVESEDVAEDWPDRWRDFHHGVRVGGLWVGPPWELPEAVPGLPPGVGETVVIDPGRAFGTGAHPTTRLTLELLQESERGSLLDVGCGSGVLAIAAAKLGFAPIHAIDVDEAAVEASRENAARNEVEMDVRQADAVVDALPQVDLVLANVALDVVETLLPRFRARRAITSGYLDRDRPDVDGWTPIDRREADGWAADLLESRP